MSHFFNKGLSDSLVKATSDIINSKNDFSVGDGVVVGTGPNTGKAGKVVANKSSGYSDVQLHHGRQITISNNYLKSASNDQEQTLLTEALGNKPGSPAWSGGIAGGGRSKKDNGKKSKKSEKIEINPDLDEIIDKHREANLMQSSRALALMKEIISTNR